jgi:hypothetical protein
MKSYQSDMHAFVGKIISNADNGQYFSLVTCVCICAEEKMDNGQWTQLVHYVQ